MPKVPYDAVPDIAPQSPGAPQLRINAAHATGQEFGALEGEALSSLGRVVEGAGNEVFSRAMAMQELKNQTEAKEADTTYMEKAGLLHAEYNSLQGKTAVEAYPKYIEDLKKTRTEIRDGMSNDASRKLYDSGSLPTMGRTIFNGAGHAAAQNKSWAIGASNARIEALGDQALSSPKDDVGFKRMVESSKAEVAQLAQLHGWGDEQKAQETSNRISDLWSKRIDGLVKQSPQAAKKMLDEAIKGGSIRGEAVGKLTDRVNQSMYTVGARNISSQVHSGTDLYWGSKPVPIQSAKAAIAGVERAGYQTMGVETRHGRALGKYQVMEEYLPGYLKAAGMDPMTPKEFLADAEAQETLFEKNFSQLMGKYGNFNDAASMWFSGKPLAEAGNRSDRVPGVYKGMTVPEYVTRANKYLAEGMPLRDKVERGASLAREAAPDAPLMEDYTRQRIESDSSQFQRIKLNDQYQNKQTIESALMGGEDGGLPTTLDELREKGPAVERAWNDLEPSVQRRYLGILAKNAKGDTIQWNEKRLNDYQRLKGMAAANPAEFLEEDIVNSDLPMSTRRELISQQIKLRGKAEGDPQVRKAMGKLLPILGPADLATRTQQNKDRYDQFVGALQDAIVDFQSDKKKPPDGEDLQKIGSRLLTNMVVPRFWGMYNSSVPVFEMQVPDEAAAKIKTTIKDALGVEPTPQQIQRAYSRELYKRLYGKPAAAPTPETKSVSVPMSQ
jgi:hypothetical protein